MALIQCPECNNTVSDKAVACPNCGYPIADMHTAQAALLDTLSHASDTTSSETNMIADGFTLFSADIVHVNLECQRCSKIYKFKRAMCFSNVSPQGCVLNTLIRCPNCGNPASANTKILPKGETAYISDSLPSSPPTTPKKSKEQEKPSICCPKCGSTQIQVSKKGFGLGKAIAGGILLGPVGLLGGAIGANNVQRVCVNCRHKF